MQLSPTTVSVKQAADMLGVSEFTVRRRIQDGQLAAVMDSKKQGYRITEESVKQYAKSQEDKIGSIWKPNTATLATVLPAPFSLFAGIIAGMQSLQQIVDESHDHLTETALDDPQVIDKFIERLNVEKKDYDLQIEYQNFKLAQAKLNNNLQAENEIQEMIFQLKSKQSQLDKDIKDLEIRKAILENGQS